jgi:uncharacterized protein YndB with AHSA1/START domain
VWKAWEDAVKVETTDGSIHMEVALAVPPMRAWAVLTERQHIANWWGDHVNLQARPGGTLRETWSDGGRQVVTSGHVTCCDPPSALELTWADDDWPGETRVAFHLAEHNAGTRLVLDHSGWGVHPVDRRSELIGAHCSAWARYLARPAEYAAEGPLSETDM